MFHDFTNLNKYTLGLRSDKHATNVLKRGNVSTGSKRTEKRALGPFVIGFFIFVVIGSSVFQMIKMIFF